MRKVHSQDDENGIVPYFDLCLMLKMLPLDMLDTVLWSTNTEQVRRRSMLPYVVVYYCIARWLDKTSSDRELLHHIVKGLVSLGLIARRKQQGSLPFSIEQADDDTKEEFGKSGLSQARTRLGWMPFETLELDIIKPIHSENSTSAKYRQWQVVSLDRTTFNIDHRLGAEFGHTQGKTRPTIHVVGLIEHGTNVLFGARMAGENEDKSTLFRGPLRYLRKDMLCVANARFYGHGFWERASSAAAHLAWGAPPSIFLPVERRLPDGTYLSYLYPNISDYENRRNQILVRVIEFAVPGQETQGRLITTLCDHKTAPASELVAVFRSRRTIEYALERTRIIDRGTAITMRSRTATLVRQEFYGLLFAHFLVCDLLSDVNELYAQDLGRILDEKVKIVRRQNAKINAAPCGDDSFIP